MNTQPTQPNRTDNFDLRLSRDAERIRRSVPSSLHSRVVDAVRAEAIAPERDSSHGRSGLSLVSVGLLAAAVVLAVLGVRRFLPAEEPAPAPENSVVSERLRDMVNLDGAPLLALANEPLLSETQGIIDDAARTARGFVDTLPAPFRRSLYR